MENLKERAITLGPQRWARKYWKNKRSITNLGLELIILHSGDIRKVSHIAGVFESISNEKAAGMINRSDWYNGWKVWTE